MCADHMSTPEIGVLLWDIRRDRLGEFRGVCSGRWYLRPPRGGREWDVDPGDVQPAEPGERLRAENARANSRSRGEVL
ncbi:hypothetical protein QIS96_29425 [Streptomyces sp. B-S-A6]|uniref:Uncharacterized protein n=1 Tax=Streptomyces cavernicola TaxID=3043613 RepID=A0ABT6SIB6_9ACTN|nr:hypothetical protein [Streptomyces sp. B-S-A6]MDI3407923.1 hypothetical protein [Streptomyces sp. B-S-A6]